MTVIGTPPRVAFLGLPQPLKDLNFCREFNHFLNDIDDPERFDMQLPNF